MFHNTVVIYYNIGVIYSTNDATSGLAKTELFSMFQQGKMKQLFQQKLLEQAS